MDGVLVVAKIWLASKPKVRGLDTAAAGQKERQLPAAIPSWPRSRDVFSSDSIPKSAAVRLGHGCYVAGDHRDTPSIQGAMFSGRRCGTAVVADLTA